MCRAHQLVGLSKLSIDSGEKKMDVIIPGVGVKMLFTVAAMTYYLCT